MTKRLDYYQAAPTAMKAMFGLEDEAKQSSLPSNLRELVRIRASQINGCAFCVDLHIADALKNGEQPRRIYALNTWKETPFFNERERMALLWAETLTLIAQNGASEEIYQQVKAVFNDQEMAELTFEIATINAWNRFGVGFGVQPE